MPRRRPVFLPSEGPDGVTLFCPPNMPAAVYNAALIKLGEYSTKSGKNMNMNMNVSMNINQVLMNGVKKGAQGEIYVTVGKEELVVYPGCGPTDLYREYSALNHGQKHAVKKVLCAQDYTLLLGLPGTGKTSTLSLIVRALIARGQRVMICSYTHSAVDNLLAKMAESGLTPSVAVRIGYEASVSSALRGYVLLLLQLLLLLVLLLLRLLCALSTLYGCSEEERSDPSSDAMLCEQSFFTLTQCNTYM
jgi:AAA domain